MSLKSELTIILPIYNPHKDWEKLLSSSLKKLETFFNEIDFKIIIVNDGSSKEITKEINTIKKQFSNIKYVSYPKNKGKGFAVKKGLQEANSNYYIYTDWDFPFGVSSINTSYKLMKNNDFDVIIGTRTLEYYKKLPFFRKFISAGLRALNFFLLGFKNIDTQAGLKGINEKGRLQFLETKTNSFIFEFEFIKRAIKNHLLINNLTVNLREDMIFTNFSLKTLQKESKNLIRMYFNKR